MMISINDFAAMKLLVGEIKDAVEHPDADRLYVLKVDLGEELPRQLVAGIRASYTKEYLIGKKLIVVSNLEPASIRGVESQGMVLAASGEEGAVLLSPEKDVPVGSRVK